MTDPWPDWITDWPRETALGRYSSQHHGDFARWQQAIENLPSLKANDIRLDTPTVTCSFRDASDAAMTQLESGLRELHPWRKGPFQLGCIHIDTEWRSDWKWDRLAQAMGSLASQRVLDIGCGNGYFGWRMLGAGAAAVVGVDPTLLFCMQHLAMQRYFAHPQHWVLPLGVEELVPSHRFDWVLSMGVLYHRKDPQAHIRQLYELTERGGNCVLETLIVEDGQTLYPPDRYARMRNIHAIANLTTLEHWMQEAGFTDVHVIDVSRTTTEEQRSTNWMHFESLDKALDPEDPCKTVEGLPAPVRAMLIGQRP
jgi:tRNA (mo5U34)-methyltransferase